MEAGNSMKQETSHVRFNVHEKELKIQTKTLGAKAKIQSNYILMFKLAQKVIGFHMCVCVHISCGLIHPSWRGFPYGYPFVFCLPLP